MSLGLRGRNWNKWDRGGSDRDHRSPGEVWGQGRFDSSETPGFKGPDEDEKVALDGPDASLLPELNLVINYILTL